MAFYPTAEINYPVWKTILPPGVLAGIAGGAAEIAWIGTFAPISGGDAGAIARGVTESLLPQLAAPGLAALLGVAIHMGLAILLGIAVAGVLRSLWPRRLRGSPLEFAAIITALAGVWAMNFFILLPVINPDFVTLVPYWASLVSKVLFGGAAASVFHFHGRRFHPAGA